MKLYKCTISVTYYACAESKRAAEIMAREAFDDFGSHYVDVEEVKSKKHVIDSDWSDDSLVYHSGNGDITLGSFLDALPDCEP